MVKSSVQNHYTKIDLLILYISASKLKPQGRIINIYIWFKHVQLLLLFSLKLKPYFITLLSLNAVILSFDFDVKWPACSQGSCGGVMSF